MGIPFLMRYHILTKANDNDKIGVLYSERENAAGR